MKEFLLVERKKRSGGTVGRSTGSAWRGLLLCLLLLSAVSPVWAQSKSVTGRVVDAANEPIPGVTVVVEGTTNGAATGADGGFSLNNVPPTGSLRISFIGYETQVIPVGDRSTFTIQLSEDRTTLDEVVVVGYGTMRRSDVTGALSRVTEKDIQERPVQNALQALQGKAAGVDITTNSRPGQLGDIRVRGNRSMTASNEPLYVIDGIPLVSGSMADLNPNDIESIEVLKDASATAIYGSRGANGVVLVTSKKGSEGRVSINYDGTVTLNTIHSLTDWMGAGELLDWERSAYVNGDNYGGSYGTAPDPARDYSLFMNNFDYMKRILGTAYQLNGNDPSNPVLRASTAEEQARGYAAMVPAYDAGKLYDQNWTDLVTRTGVTNNHQVSVTSGSQKGSLYFSLGYLDQKYPMKDQNYERYTVNINGNANPISWLKIGTSLNAAYSVQNYGMVNNPSDNAGAKDSYSQALALKPYAPAYDEDGNVLKPGMGNGPSANNVLVNMANGTNENRVYSIMNSTFAEVKLFPWLRYRVNIGGQFRLVRNGSYYDKDFTNPLAANPPASQPLTGYSRDITNFSWVIENLLFIDKEWGKHSVGVTLLQSAENQRSENIWIRSQGLQYPSSLWYSLSSNSQGRPHGYNTGFSEQSLASYMARVNYTFNRKYLITLTGRWDGASVLAAGNKWDFFPSTAIAWKMEEEEFIRRVTWINQLKLRFGYGVTGNSSVSPYTTTGALTGANQVVNDQSVSGVKASVMPNPNLKWEKTAQLNIGLDFSLLRQRISGSIEYYQAKTSDLIMQRSIPAFVGYSEIRYNIGKTMNTGVEVTLSTINIQRGDFTWTTDLNWSKNKEEIVELVNGKEDMTGNSWFIGHPLGVSWAMNADRLWQDTPEDQRLMELYKKIGSYSYRPGQAKPVDRQPMVEVSEGTAGSSTYTLSSGEKVTVMNNGFGVFNNDDNFIMSRRPDWTGGMTNTFTYKNWQFNFMLHARMGGYYYGLMQTYGRRVETDVWSPTNTGGKYPQPVNDAAMTDHSKYLSYTKGNMFMVRNIALSYTFPKSILEKVGMQSGSVYFQLLNPFIFGGDLVKAGINPDDQNGWGSDAYNSGGQTGNTILMRSYVFGLRFGF